MDEFKMENNIEALDDLRDDARRIQRSGLPFMLSSVILWSMISLVQFFDISQVAKNTFTFGCSMFLFPLSLLFAKILKTNIIKRTKNPVNSLGFMITMNQMLYLIIVMWVYNQRPVGMLMVYAMVFGAHLLPFCWVYDCKGYMVMSIIETIGAFFVCIFLGNRAIAPFIIICQIILNILIFANERKAARKVEN
ncbi:MAG: hypothetical protein K5988_00740 [Lachnospiraceae bacterium]|nr:hypothetical protein [Lachnospiraceae bacterium]